MIHRRAEFQFQLYSLSSFTRANTLGEGMIPPLLPPSYKLIRETCIVKIISISKNSYNLKSIFLGGGGALNNPQSVGKP